jgi:VWFA-related protein
MLRTNSLYRWALVLLLTVSTVPAWAQSQSDQTEPIGVFFEPLEVPLVSLEVHVADHGLPVTGLTLDDFQILVDGQPVEITHFYASWEEQAKAEEQASPAAPNQDLLLAVYIDQTNFGMSQRAVALQNLRSLFSQELPEALHMMLVVYNGNLHVAQGITNDPELLLNAVEEISGNVSANYNMERLNIIRQIEMKAEPNLSNTQASGKGFGVNDPDDRIQTAEFLLREIESYANQRQTMAQRNIETLKSFVRSLSGFHGRKAVFYMSDGVEMRPGHDLFMLWDRAFEQLARQQAFNVRFKADRYSLHTDIKQLVEFANDYRISFYTLSSLSRGMPSSASTERRGVRGGSGMEILSSANEEVFIQMTAGTGGRSLANNSRLDAHLAGVAKELGSYYSFGFRPSSTDQSKYHKITVKVRDRNVDLRHREGYRIKTAAELMTDRTVSAAIHRAARNPLGISVESSNQQLQGDGNYMVPLLVKVPLDQIVLIPKSTTHEGRISIYLVVRDDQGRLSDCHHREYPVEIENQQLVTAISQQAGFTMGMVMREGDQVVAVGVRDELGNSESIVTRTVNVGATPESSDDSVVNPEEQAAG